MPNSLRMIEVQQEEGVLQNGLYCEKEKTELIYPFGTKISIHSKTIGPDILKSDYTAPVEVMVS